ncbi:acetyl-CoA carboxylase carboxyltransferase subunit beta [bacterium]|nr:acetyl-CoA carboxylase carboxyltransferase subunit beta [bacterium]MCK4437383.1 acetyl-CoA carboxylase carboxyltransferase subunit beta [bacterium]
MVWFRKPKYIAVSPTKKEMPDGLWTKCEDCGEIIYNKELEENIKVCSKCNYHFRLGARERISLLLDEDSLQEYDRDMSSSDPLSFQGVKSYKEKLSEDQSKTGLIEAVVTGEGRLNGHPLIISVTDYRFIMGSMGSVVGEKITRAIERAMEKKLPFLSISGSGGGARMYEGMLSLMQMAKTSGAVAKLGEKGLLFISLLTDPTMGGVAASFASLGDIVIAEPKALIGFAGPRVIRETIGEELPPGFQKAEFMLEHGLIDMIVPRKELKVTLSNILSFFGRRS